MCHIVKIFLPYDPVNGKSTRSGNGEEEGDVVPFVYTLPVRSRERAGVRRSIIARVVRVGGWTPECDGRTDGDRKK